MCNCHSSCMVTNTTAQTVAVNGIISLTSGIKNGCAIKYVDGSNTINLRAMGEYLVTVNASITGTSAGDTELQLLNKGTAIAGARATATLASGDTANIAFNTIVRIAKSCQCADNHGALQVQLLTTSATINNIAVNVVKIA